MWLSSFSVLIPPLSLEETREKRVSAMAPIVPVVRNLRPEDGLRVARETYRELVHIREKSGREKVGRRGKETAVDADIGRSGS